MENSYILTLNPLLFPLYHSDSICERERERTPFFQFFSMPKWFDMIWIHLRCWQGCWHKISMGKAMVNSHVNINKIQHFKLFFFSQFFLSCSCSPFFFTGWSTSKSTGVKWKHPSSSNSLLKMLIYNFHLIFQDYVFLF